MGETVRAKQVAGAAQVRAHVTDAIVRAVLDELADVGYARMSMESVARRAGVGKAAIYRRWRSKESMVQQIVSTLAWNVVPIPDTGSLAGDVTSYVEHAAALQADRRATRIIAELGVAALASEQLAQTFYANMRHPRREAGAQMLRRAVSRKELPDDLDPDLALDCLVSLAYARPQTLTRSGEFRDPYPHERLVAVILAALSACRVPVD